MAKEDRKDFNAMLQDNKDMPRIQIITDPKSIEKYGGSRMYFARPMDYDQVMKRVPCGKLVTVGTIRGNRPLFAEQKIQGRHPAPSRRSIYPMPSGAIPTLSYFKI